MRLAAIQITKDLPLSTGKEIVTAKVLGTGPQVWMYRPGLQDVFSNRQSSRSRTKSFELRLGGQVLRTHPDEVNLSGLRIMP